MISSEEKYLHSAKWLLGTICIITDKHEKTIALVKSFVQQIITKKMVICFNNFLISF